jgi:hypothetical protein
MFGEYTEGVDSYWLIPQLSLIQPFDQHLIFHCHDFSSFIPFQFLCPLLFPI